MNIADDLRMALDPVAFAEAAGIVPDPWQADVLRSAEPRMLLNCSRQSGKSTTAAVLAVHTALYDPGALVLLLSPSLRQSQELFRKCLALYRAAGRPVAAVGESTLRLELANGGRIVALPGNEENVRGFSAVRLLVVDEAARVPDDLYLGLRPMLAVSGGRLIAMSTPCGKRGWWHREWAEGGDAWARVAIPAAACPRIDPAFLAGERAALGDWWYRQEYACQFGDTLDAVFAHDVVARAVTAEATPLFGR